MQKIICTVTNDLNQDQRMHRICKTLADHGYSVTLVGRLKPTSLPIQTRTYQQIRLKCWFSKGVLFYLEYNMRLCYYLLDGLPKHSIIYTVDSDTLLAGGIVRFMKGVYQVFDAHEYFTKVPELKTRPRARWIWEYIENFFVPKADLHITVGYRLAELFTKKYGKKFLPILNVPNSGPHRIVVDKGEPAVILYQGMLNQGRGLEQMIAAMEKIEGAVFHIIGEGDISSELRILATNSFASERIQFLGWKSPAEMSTITSKATLAINLLDNNSLSYYYSLANKFFDYIHAAVPSINMAFPEYVEIIERYKVGVTLESLDPSLIATTINDLLSHPEKMENMRVACAAAKQVYHWDIEAQKLIGMVDQLQQ